MCVHAMGLRLGRWQRQRKSSWRRTQKFKTQIVANKLSYYEIEMQYWVKLNNGKQIQIPPYLYENVTVAEESFIVKAQGGSLDLAENRYCNRKMHMD